MKSLVNDMKKDENGSITVFLSLILLLIFAMCATLIEGARIHTGRQREQLILEAAVDGVFTEYYLPLYENYHVFFLNRGIDTDTLTGEEFLSSIREYIFSGMSTEGEDWQGKGIDLYKDKLVSIKLTGAESAVGKEGEIFRNEVLEYMKYKAAGSTIEAVLEKMDLFSAAQKTGKVLKHKLAAEEAMGQLDQLILDEIGYIEGVVFKKNGTLKASGEFGKKYAVDGTGMSAVGIDNSLIYSTMLPEYINPVEGLNGLIQKAEKLIRYVREREKLEEKLDSFDEEPEPESKAEQARQKKRKAAIRKKLKKIKTDINSLSKEIRVTKKRITLPAAGSVLCIQNARETLPRLKEKQEEIIKKLKEYEDALNEHEGQIPSETYDGLLNDLKEKQDYVGNKERIEASMIDRLLGMETKLTENQKILESFMEYEAAGFEEEEESLTTFIEVTKSYKEIIEPCKIDMLKFDYSNVKISEKVKSPLETMQNFLEEGMMALVIPEGVEVSEKSLPEGDRLYKLNSQNPGDQENPKQMGDSLKGVDNDGYNSEITDSAGQFGDEDIQGDSAPNDSFEGNFISKKAQDLLENILLNQYAVEHTVHFPAGKENAPSEEESRSGLMYEMEYLIQGEDSDRDNLQGIINRILFTRTMLNFIAVLTDSEKRAMAHSTAAALVGFTGMEPLIILTQTLILVAWSYEEAVVDTAAMFLGKSVPILKSPSDFQMQYTDLLCISPALIKQKARAMTDTATGLSINYEEFLFINLLTIPRARRCYRLMDLADACCKKYQEDFAIERCIFSIEIEAEFKMPVLFSGFAYVQDALTKEKKFQGKSIYENRIPCFHSY